jgi:hypothetical protein
MEVPIDLEPPGSLAQTPNTVLTPRGETFPRPDLSCDQDLLVCLSVFDRVTDRLDGETTAA